MAHLMLNVIIKSLPSRPIWNQSLQNVLRFAQIVLTFTSTATSKRLIMIPATPHTTGAFIDTENVPESKNKQVLETVR